MKRFFHRLIFSLKMSYQYRKNLAEVYLNSPRRQRTSHLVLNDFKAQGVEVLVLDFDGVLAAHAEQTPLDALQQWLAEGVSIFGENRVFILSNKPNSQRIQYFQQYFQGVQVISGVRKKPYADGLQQIIEITQCPATHILMVDDRLLTGVLAACIANTRVAYITHPYTNFEKRPLQESFFSLLRFSERRLMQTYCLLKKKKLLNQHKVQ